MSISRYSIKITGIVQGVGFRPFVYNLAKSLYLNGWVSNKGSNVIIDVEGEKKALESFVAALKNNAPPLSRLKSIEISECLPAGSKSFEIRKSTGFSEDNVFISNDVAVCKDCLHELFDRNDRRYLYPFINCTNCGPRFTIVKGVPYDRERTTMSIFPMCSKCSEEYTNPADRRYHAQPVSCRQCGPRLYLTDNSGNTINADPMEYARELLISGKNSCG
jgi:hydrogenase maturation protein HypF